MENRNLTRGHNNPPSPIEMAKPIIAGISEWMAANPVYLDHSTAACGARHVDTISKHIADLEDERKSIVKPLNDEVKSINASYKEATAPLDKLKTLLKERATAYAIKEEAERKAEAEKLRLAAEEAERIARAAVEAENEAIDCAEQGEVGVDIGAVTLAADESIAAAEKARRTALVAEQQSHIKMKAGNARALSLRTTIVFDVIDPVAAMLDLPLTDKIRDAIISAAREYHKEHGKPPAGVTAREERKV